MGWLQISAQTLGKPCLWALHGAPAGPPLRLSAFALALASCAGLTSIRHYAFYGCSSLASVELPAGLTSIPAYAFSGCSSLASVVLPAGLEDIGDNAFPSGCTICRTPAQ